VSEPREMTPAEASSAWACAWLCPCWGCGAAPGDGDNPVALCCSCLRPVCTECWCDHGHGDYAGGRCGFPEEVMR
jgi:hypothetical protein